MTTPPHSPDLLVLIAGFSTEPVPQADFVAFGDKIKAVDAVRQALFSGTLNARQIEQFMLLETARELLPGNGRLQHCHARRVDAARPVTTRQAESGFVWFDNVQTCGLPICPVCGPRMAWQLRRRAVSIARGAEVFGFVPYAVTLTSRHTRGDDLGTLVGRQVRAVSGMFSGGSALPARLRGVGIEYAGHCRALESTYSAASGFHPHNNVILFAHAAAIEDVTGIIRESYAKLGRKHRLDLAESAAHVGPLFDADGVDFDAVGYAFKDGRGMEGQKHGLTPFQILSAAQRGDGDAGSVWREYAQAMLNLRGKHDLTQFSKGLSAFASVV